MNKKVNLFGKSIPVFVIAILGLAVVSAALLSYYGVITGSAIVSQSVTVENSPIKWSETFVAGKTITYCDTDDSGYSVKNNANVGAPIKFGTTCNNSAGGDDETRNESYIDWISVVGNDRCDGIVTDIYGVLELTSKDVNWNPTENMKATLYYTIVGNQFKYKVDVTQGTLENYVVVYYPDVSATGTDGPGKKPWNINNAVNLGVVTNVWTISTLSTSLPVVGDYNANPNTNDTYCEDLNGFDSYVHCAGAKIWLMSQTDLTNKAWNPNAWLFETDLIVYSKDTGNVITLPANGGGFNFCVENDFAFNLVPDTYTLETKVLPA